MLGEDGGQCLPGPAYLTWRRKARIYASQWLQQGSLDTLLLVLDRHKADSIEVALLERRWSVPPEAWHAVFADAQRGRLGLLVSCGARWQVVTPAETIATNRSFFRSLQRILSTWGYDDAGFRAAGGKLEAFSGPEILIDRRLPEGFTYLYRGQSREPLPDEGRVVLERLLEGAQSWLLAQQRSDGALAYKYWPSQGRYSKANNTIRQFMATLALIDLAAYRADPAILQAATAALQANLALFLKREGPIAVVEHEGKAKLGAAALAALCLLRHPEAEGSRETRLALEAAVLALWQSDGAFRTYHRPAERNDNQNFYPGEALLYLAQRLQRFPNEALRDRVVASLRYYRRRHRRDPNPAFVPWHSLAIRSLAPDPSALPADLLQHLFAMNDWLADLQQWERAPHRDMAGRFYAADRPDFGPPHASSTGVYLEGLAAAFSCAEALGEKARAAGYAQTIWRGLCHLDRLQFRDPAECFYLSRPDRVLGGLRSEVYDNTLRIDNAQHAVAALLAILQQPALLAAKPSAPALSPPDPPSAAGLASQ